MTTDAVVLDGGPNPRMRVIGFHHAGGSAVSLLPLMRSAPADVEVRLVDLPGRGLRSRTPRAETFGAAAADLLSVTAGWFDRPTILFGHSLGAALADATAGALPAAAAAHLRLVILSAGGRPVAARPGRPDRSEEDLRGELAAHGGTPPEVFETPALLRGVLGMLGDDMRLVDTYPGRGTAGGRPVPYEVWYGRDDATVGRLTAAQWQDVLSAPARVRDFPGGHFQALAPAGPAAAVLAGLLAAGSTEIPEVVA